MFITMPLSYEGRLIQYVGRLHREYKNKDNVIVYDYIDNNIKMLQNAFQKRLKTYKKEGYKNEYFIISINSASRRSFDDKTFCKLAYANHW